MAMTLSEESKRTINSEKSHNTEDGFTCKFLKNIRKKIGPEKISHKSLTFWQWGVMVGSLGIRLLFIF